MSVLIIFEQGNLSNLFPIDALTPTILLEIGINNFHDRWIELFENENPDKSIETIIKVRDHLKSKYEYDEDLEFNLFDSNQRFKLCNYGDQTSHTDIYIINSSVYPDKNLVKDLRNEYSYSKLTVNGNDLCVKLSRESIVDDFLSIPWIDYEYSSIKLFNRPWDLLNLTRVIIEDDILKIANKSSIYRITTNPSYHTYIDGSSKIGNLNIINDNERLIFNCVGPGVVFDNDDGSIYIGKNVIIEPNVYIKGPVMILDNCFIKSNTSLTGPLIIGSVCKIGGEVAESIFMGYSNKAHYGYVGCSIVGKWCNIGAGTTTSNLKNNYSNINYSLSTKLTDNGLKYFNVSKPDKTDRKFFGSVIGDHTKIGINKSLMPGSCFGPVSCISDIKNWFVTSPFSWNDERYDYDKAIETIQIIMKRRNISMSGEEYQVLKNLYNLTIVDKLFD